MNPVIESMSSQYRSQKRQQIEELTNKLPLPLTKDNIDILCIGRPDFSLLTGGFIKKIAVAGMYFPVIHILEVIDNSIIHHHSFKAEVSKIDHYLNNGSILDIKNTYSYILQKEYRRNIIFENVSAKNSVFVDFFKKENDVTRTVAKIFIKLNDNQSFDKISSPIVNFTHYPSSYIINSLIIEELLLYPFANQSVNKVNFCWQCQKQLHCNPTSNSFFCSTCQTQFHNQEFILPAEITEDFFNKGIF